MLFWQVYWYLRIFHGDSEDAASYRVHKRHERDMRCHNHGIALLLLTLREDRVQKVYFTPWLESVTNWSCNFPSPSQNWLNHQSVDDIFRQSRYSYCVSPEGINWFNGLILTCKQGFVKGQRWSLWVLSFRVKFLVVGWVVLRSSLFRGASCFSRLPWLAQNVGLSTFSAQCTLDWFSVSVYCTTLFAMWVTYLLVSGDL